MTAPKPVPVHVLIPPPVPVPVPVLVESVGRPSLSAVVAVGAAAVVLLAGSGRYLMQARHI